MFARKITIVIRGTTETDAEDAFNEAVERLANGCVSGTDRNETSGFYFQNSPVVDPSELPA